MKKTSIYVDEKVDRALTRLAEAEGKSKSELVREALAERASRAPKLPRITAIGVGSGPGDLAEEADRYAREALDAEQ